MKNFTTCICIMGLSGVAAADIMWDQIGDYDGSGLGLNIMACQDFEAAFDAYDAVVADNFTGDGTSIDMLEVVIGGWNGFVDPSSITGYSANLYSSAEATGVSLIGDIDSNDVDVANVTIDANWTGGNFLFVLDPGLTSIAGEQLIGLIPSNDFATGGQTGVADSADSDGTAAIQGNPGEAYGFGTWQSIVGDDLVTPVDAAYRIGGFQACNIALPTLCPADVDMDGFVAVSDVLAIIGSWGDCGDGTYRPLGDIAPGLYGDCCVTVADVLAVVGSWGADCTVYGACCYENETCADTGEAACTDAGGTWNGDGSDCAGTSCEVSIIPGDECATALPAIVGANPFEITTMTASDNAPTDGLCSTTSFGWVATQPDVWFMYVSDGGLTTFDTCDSTSYDTSMALYEGSCDNLVACNGDSSEQTGCQGYYSEITNFDCVVGETYYVRIGGWDGATGAGTLNISPPPDPNAFGACCYEDETCIDVSAADCIDFLGNFQGDGTDCSTGLCEAGPGDECDGAIDAFEGANLFDTTFMTASTPAPDESMCPGEQLAWLDSADMWMQWVATSSGNATFSTCQVGSFDTSIVLYEGTCENQIACNGDQADDPDGGGACQAWYSLIDDVPVTAGETYYIRLGGWQGAVGAGTLTISTGADVAAACCFSDGSCSEYTSADCSAAGGSYDSSSMCADGNCIQPFACPAGADQEGDPCQVDGTEADSNCGLNCDPALFGSLSTGVTLCGDASVMPGTDDPEDGSRDTDWYSNADLDAGGDFTLTGASNGSSVGHAFGIIDNNNPGAWVDVFLTSTESSVTFSVPPGSYSVFVAQNGFESGGECGSGTEEYWVLLETSVTTYGACCVDLICSDMTVGECTAAGGLFDDSQDCSTAVCSAAASGDECATALPAMDGANAFDTSVMSASQPQPDEETCSGQYYMDWNNCNDGWYMYVATGGITTFDTCDAGSFDTSLVLYEDSCSNQVACNGDADDSTGCQTYSSSIEYDCVAGATYYVRIGEWNGGPGGAGTLNIN